MPRITQHFLALAAGACILASFPYFLVWCLLSYEVISGAYSSTLVHDSHVLGNAGEISALPQVRAWFCVFGGALGWCSLARAIAHATYPHMRLRRWVLGGLFVGSLAATAGPISGLLTAPAVAAGLCLLLYVWRLPVFPCTNEV